jgi:hypothetical protein
MVQLRRLRQPHPLTAEQRLNRLLGEAFKGACLLAGIGRVAMLGERKSGKHQDHYKSPARLVHLGVSFP